MISAVMVNFSLLDLGGAVLATRAAHITTQPRSLSAASSCTGSASMQSACCPTRLTLRKCPCAHSSCAARARLRPARIATSKSATTRQCASRMSQAGASKGPRARSSTCAIAPCSLRPATALRGARSSCYYQMNFLLGMFDDDTIIRSTTCKLKHVAKRKRPDHARRDGSPTLSTTTTPPPPAASAVKTPPKYRALSYQPAPSDAGAIPRPALLHAPPQGTPTLPAAIPRPNLPRR